MDFNITDIRYGRFELKNNDVSANSILIEQKSLYEVKEFYLDSMHQFQNFQIGKDILNLNFDYKKPVLFTETTQVALRLIQKILTV